MTIKQLFSDVSNSSNALVASSFVTVVAAAIAAKYEKPVIAAGLLGLSTSLNVREIYIRHNKTAASIQNILLKSREISEMDVPANIAGDSEHPTYL